MPPARHKNTLQLLADLLLQLSESYGLRGSRGILLRIEMSQSALGNLLSCEIALWKNRRRSNAMSPRLGYPSESASEKLVDIEGLSLGVAGERVVVGRLSLIEESASTWSPIE